MNKKLLAPIYAFALALAGFTLFAPKPALAGDLSGKVLSVVVWTSGTGNTWARVDLDTTRMSAPTCAMSTPKNRFVFRINTDAGKGILSLLLLARSSGLPVWLDGANGCPPATEGDHVRFYEELTTASLN